MQLLFHRFNDELKKSVFFLKSSREGFSNEGKLIKALLFKALVNSSEWEIILKLDESESWGKYFHGRVSQITLSFESLRKLKFKESFYLLMNTCITKSLNKVPPILILI